MNTKIANTIIDNYKNIKFIINLNIKEIIGILFTTNEFVQ
tara:strand:+ start:706 stop:825 length:120 start_codon:yes stop_codon:yes gene_type:complete